VGYVDLFDFVPGVPEAVIEEFVADAQIHNGRLFASLEWLKRMKQASNRPQDRIDLEHLP
jgi:hypothetical protein